MGLHERDYGREYGEETEWDRQQRYRERSSKSVAIVLLVITCGVYLVDMLFSKPGNGMISQLGVWLGVQADTAIKPWKWYQLLTYGFMHARVDIMHLVGNMIGLFFFGRAMEQKLGGKEFLRFYLVSMIFAGLVGSLTYLLLGPPNGLVIGASGAVVAITVLFACYFPNQEILLMFVFPLKAWVLAVLFVGFDTFGAMGIIGGNTAFTVHLAGAGFALLYYFRNWSLSFLDIGGFAQIRQNMRQRSRRMKLKIHDPDKKYADEAEEADRILAKISASGIDSLTAAEKKVMERHSRRVQKKRNS